MKKVLLRTEACGWLQKLRELINCMTILVDCQNKVISLDMRVID